MNITPEWLLVTASVALLISLVEAWIVTLIIYGKVSFLKSIFPAYQNLIRSHVDYTIMTALLGGLYFALVHLNITIPDAIIVILCVGVLYNPFGFILKAINPKAGQAETVWERAVVCAGFMPATIGFGYCAVAIIRAIV